MIGFKNSSENRDNTSTKRHKRSVILTSSNENIDNENERLFERPVTALSTTRGRNKDRSKQPGKGIILQLPKHISEDFGKSNNSTSSLDTTEEKESSSDSEEMDSTPKTMAEVVMLAKFQKKRKLKEKTILDVGSFPTTDDTSFSYSLNDQNVEMSKIERIGVISVLEDCIDQLFILGKTNNKPPAAPDLLFKTLKERFSDRERTKVDPEEVEGKAETLNDSKKIIKLQRDRATIEMILQMTLHELKSTKTSRTLLEVTEFEMRKQNEEEELISKEQKNAKELSNLRSTLKKELKDGINKINKKHEIIARLKDEIQDTVFMNDLKFKYVSHWEKSREEQNTEKLSLAEKKLEEELIGFKDNLDIELRCHVEVEAYMKQAITHLEQEIEKWMEKYDIELENRADDLQRLQAKRAAEYAELEELALMHQQRQSEIDSYLEHKKNAAAKAAHETYLNQMATRIQAWWKGTMVRRGLGPYKKSKKGKDKKGKGKGSKGGARMKSATTKKK